MVWNWMVAWLHPGVYPVTVQGVIRLSLELIWNKLLHYPSTLNSIRGTETDLMDTGTRCCQEEIASYHIEDYNACTFILRAVRSTAMKSESNVCTLKINPACWKWASECWHQAESSCLQNDHISEDPQNCTFVWRLLLHHQGKQGIFNT